MAPMTRASPSSRTPAARRPCCRSTSTLGNARRSRSTGMSDWPPARILPSSPASPRAVTASATVVGGDVVELGGDHARTSAVVAAAGGAAVGDRCAAVGDGPSRRSGAVRVDGPPDPLGGGRHDDVVDAERAQRVDDGVHDRRGRGDAAGLADALDAEHVARRGGLGAAGVEVRQVGRARDEVVDHRAGDEVALGVVDGLLVQRLRDALGEPAVDLALDDDRVDDLADVVDADVLADLGEPGLGVDLDRAQVRAVRVGEVLRVVDVVAVERRLHAVGQVVRREGRERHLLDRQRRLGRALDAERAGRRTRRRPRTPRAGARRSAWPSRAPCRWPCGSRRRRRPASASRRCPCPWGRSRCRR